MELNEIKQVRLDKLKNLSAKNVSAYGGRFEQSSFIAKVLENFVEGAKVRLAGRILAQRKHGKVVFMDLMDQTAKMQIFLKADNLGAEKFELVNELDMGDIIGIEGELFTTKMGEKSVRVSNFEVLAKSLMGLPEKWHGLKDVDTRYRQRYIDLIANEEVRRVFMARSKIISFIRSFLDRLAFLEVETPMLQILPGGARGKPFKSHHNAYDLDIFLRIAPELYLKRLLVGGLDRVYELNRNFRNEGVSTRHNPEFTMLEVYQAYGDYTDMMKLTEDMISQLAKEITGSYKIQYQGKEIDLTPPWERRSFARVVKDQFGIDATDNAQTMLDKLKAKRGKIGKIDKITRSSIMKFVEDLLEEEQVNRPIFFTEYFTFLCPLAKTIADNPAISERF